VRHELALEEVGVEVFLERREAGPGPEERLQDRGVEDLGAPLNGGCKQMIRSTPVRKKLNSLARARSTSRQALLC
jgi:hypothetical protein